MTHNLWVIKRGLVEKIKPSSSTSLQISVTLVFWWIKPSGQDGSWEMSFSESRFSALSSSSRAIPPDPGFGPIRPVFFFCSPRSSPMVDLSRDTLHFGFSFLLLGIFQFWRPSLIGHPYKIYNPNPDWMFRLMREQRRIKMDIPIKFIIMHFWFLFFSGLEIQKSNYKFTWTYFQLWFARIWRFLIMGRVNL